MTSPEAPEQERKKPERLTYSSAIQKGISHAEKLIHDRHEKIILDDSGLLVYNPDFLDGHNTQLTAE